MLFPPAQAAPVAEAQSSRNGYTYTLRICQELGQQPRRYNVRDPIPGSDWRSDGGWAIVLVRGTSIRDTRIATFNTNYIVPNYRYTTNRWALDTGRSITDRSGGVFNGLTGLVQINVRNNGQRVETNVIWVDHNRDGRIDNADLARGPQNNQYERLLFTETGSIGLIACQYIRWANMLWCR